MEAVVNYLNWDRETERHGPATDLFNELHSVEPEIPDLTATEFDDLYREVRTLEDAPEDLEQIWREWNRGSGQTSEEFRETLYCEPCNTYQIGTEHAVQHAVDNHGYDGLHKSGVPEYVHGIRSMSVGDVIETPEAYNVAAPIGFEEITVGDEL